MLPGGQWQSSHGALHAPPQEYLRRCHLRDRTSTPPDAYQIHTGPACRTPSVRPGIRPPVPFASSLAGHGEAAHPVALQLKGLRLRHAPRVPAAWASGHERASTSRPASVEGLTQRTGQLAANCPSRPLLPECAYSLLESLSPLTRHSKAREGAAEARCMPTAKTNGTTATTRGLFPGGDDRHRVDSETRDAPFFKQGVLHETNEGFPKWHGNDGISRCQSLCLCRADAD